MITKSYIKMCEQAEEIQKSYTKCNMGDYIHDENHTWFSTFIWHEGLNNNIWEWVQETAKQKRGLPKEKYNLLTRNYIWLPTQEQLQEILFESKDLNLADWFAVFFDKYFYIDKIDLVKPQERTKKFHSFKELWFNLVMCELYNKTWTGKKWEVN